MCVQLIGTWEIVSSADFDDEYLNLEGTPSIRLHQNGDRIVGEYHIGVQSGGVDGRSQPDGSVLFTFEGMDEMDEVHGAGTAAGKDGQLMFTLMYHQGDDYTYTGERRS